MNFKQRQKPGVADKAKAYTAIQMNKGRSPRLPSTNDADVAYEDLRRKRPSMSESRRTK